LKRQARSLKKFTRSVFQDYFQVFWKGLTCKSISMHNTRSRNDVQCPFVH